VAKLADAAKQSLKLLLLSSERLLNAISIAQYPSTKDGGAISPPDAEFLSYIDDLAIEHQDGLTVRRWL
jgi:hypothetical protein